MFVGGTRVNIYVACTFLEAMGERKRVWRNGMGFGGGVGVSVEAYKFGELPGILGSAYCYLGRGNSSF